MGEGRGHLNRARLAAQLLAPHGIQVDVVTTNPESVAFMRQMGSDAALLSSKYRLAYNERQNLSRLGTWASGLSYLALPTRCARDIAWLTGYAHDASLIVDDSLHPTLILASCTDNALTSRIVHIHGQNVRRAVEDTVRGGRAQLGVPLGTPLAVVYLNPYFRDPALADIIDRAMRGRFIVHAIAEGFAHRPGWHATDPHLADAVAAADVFISAAGMGSLTLARTTGVPMIALATRQPEQRKNLAETAAATSWRRVIDISGDLDDDLAAPLARALADLPASHHGPTDALLAIRRSRHHWTEALLSLVSSSHRKAHS
jgi:hypothetical protein